MNTALTVHPATPHELLRAAPFAVQRLIELMWMFGIAGVDTTWAPVGMSGVMTVSLTPMDKQPEGAYAALQPKMARWVAEGMQIFGILTLNHTPTAEELAEIEKAWSGLGGTSETPKLPPDVDPLNE